MGFGLNAGAIGVAAMIGAGVMATQSNDLMSKYKPTPAVIVSTEVDCFIKDGNSKIESKTTGEIAYMDCKAAPQIAVRFNYDARDIQQRVTAVYRYRSHVDGKEYEGKFTREGYGKAKKLPVGATVPVFASNEKPDESRTSSGNAFINDNLEI